MYIKQVLNYALPWANAEAKLGIDFLVDPRKPLPAGMEVRPHRLESPVVHYDAGHISRGLRTANCQACTMVRFATSNSEFPRRYKYEDLINVLRPTHA